MDFRVRKIIYKVPVAHACAKLLVRCNNRMFYKRYIKKRKDIEAIWNHLALKRKSDRCFIIGNGPSLKVSDLEKLQDEDCFASNKCYKIFTQTAWRPKYYVAQDIYSMCSEKIDNLECENILLSDYFCRKHNISSEKYICFPTYKALSFEDVFFAKDILKGVCDAYTVSFSMIQIAVYLGYKKIYLLGMDHSYPVVVNKKGKIKKDFNVRAHFFGEEKLDYVTNIEGMNRAYKVVKDFSDENNIEIYNVTRGGKLEIFPRANLESITLN